MRLHPSRLHMPIRTRKETRTVKFCIKPLPPLLPLNCFEAANADVRDGTVNEVGANSVKLNLELLATEEGQTRVYRPADISGREKLMLSSLELAQVRWNAPTAKGASPLRHIYLDFRNRTFFSKSWWYTREELAKASYSVEALVSGTALPIFGLRQGNNSHVLTVCSDSGGLEAKLNSVAEEGVSLYGLPNYCMEPILWAFKQMEREGKVEARGTYTVTLEKPYAPVLSPAVRHASAVLVAVPSYAIAAGLSLIGGVSAALLVGIAASETIFEVLPSVNNYYMEHIAGTNPELALLAIPAVTTAAFAGPCLNFATQVVLDSGRGIEERFNSRFGSEKGGRGSYASPPASSSAASA